MHIEDELARVDCLDEALELTVVRMGGVGHLEVERQVFIILVVPACHDYENRWLFPVALVDAADIERSELDCVSGFYRAFSDQSDQAGLLTHGI